MLQFIFFLIVLILAKHFFNSWQKRRASPSLSVTSETSNIEKIEPEKKDRFIAYSKKHSFLTPPEKTFYSTLCKVLGNDYLLFSQIGMLGIFDLKRIYDKKDYFFYLHKIQAKRIDFLVCDKQTTEPLLAIELDDRTHARADRIKRDDYVDQVFKDTKLPLIHIRTAFEAEELLKKQLQPYLPGLTFIENPTTLN